MENSTILLPKRKQSHLQLELSTEVEISTSVDPKSFLLKIDNVISGFVNTVRRKWISFRLKPASKKAYSYQYYSQVIRDSEVKKLRNEIIRNASKNLHNRIL